MNIFEFMSGSPFLTFFLFCAICETVGLGFKALGGKYKNNSKEDDK